MKIYEGDSTERGLKARERVGQKIFEARKKRHLTQEELASLCGVNRVNISKIEKGAYNVSIDILSKIAFALGCAVDIKVGSYTVPTPFSKRQPVKLVIGEEYYVSFGNHDAKRCKLLDIIDDRGPKQVKIEILSSRGSTIHILFADEIGTTPEEAVMNEVTL